MNKKINNLRLIKSGFVFSFVFLLVISLLSYSCKKIDIPRPYGYFRVNLPEHDYKVLETLNLPYTLEISKMSHTELYDTEHEKFWINIVYPSLNAKIHCSYKPINNNLYELSEDARQFVFKHTSRADNIIQEVFEKPENSTYGILYDLKGNVASPVQFVVTDSVHHFFRGALYFENVPNKDSIAPMANYVREDIIHLMESFKWKK